MPQTHCSQWQTSLLQIMASQCLKSLILQTHSPHLEKQSLPLKNPQILYKDLSNFVHVIKLDFILTPENIETEKLILDDLLFVFQGIDGKYIYYDSKNECYMIQNVFTSLF